MKIRVTEIDLNSAEAQQVLQNERLLRALAGGEQPDPGSLLPPTAVSLPFSHEIPLLPPAAVNLPDPFEMPSFGEAIEVGAQTAISTLNFPVIPAIPAKYRRALQVLALAAAAFTIAAALGAVSSQVKMGDSPGPESSPDAATGEALPPTSAPVPESAFPFPPLP